MTTNTALETLPLTLAERDRAPDILRVKASFGEYLDFAEQCQYNVDYFNGEIVSMSQATLPHELLVGRLITVFNILFDDDETVQVFSSNIKIHVAAAGDSFNADVSILRGEADYLRLPSGRLSTVEVQNPELIVEILSKSTMAYDLGDKLKSYKQVPSLRQVLFVSQHKPWVSSYVRVEMSDEWLDQSFHALTDSVQVLDKAVSLAGIYKKFKFV